METIKETSMETSTETITKRQSSNIMTKYEKARILGIRAMQISMNSPLMIDPKTETDPMRIALMELRERKIPMTIRRKLPNGIIEDWDVNEMIIDN